MATNPSERYLSELAQRSFLDLWTVPNPFKKAGKELTDLLVVFGNDIVVVSDKASTFVPDKANAWQKWRRKTIEHSSRQLNTAVKALQNPRILYLDAAATKAFPYALPDPAVRRYHLLNIARPAHDPKTPAPGWPGLIYDNSEIDQAFNVGPEFANGHFVHIFDSDDIEFLLSQLDTAPDFLDYLMGRENAIRGAKSLRFKERDLFATAVTAWRNGERFSVTLPPANGVGRIDVPKDLWAEYAASEGSTLTSKQYGPSRTFDRLINHFHEEYAADRTLSAPKPSYDTHESALRIMASESRLARRMIVDALMSIFEEEDTRTFWASTVPSPDHPDVRYVWLTYHALPEGAELRDYERYILAHLRQHLFVARLTFGAATYVGMALPNKNAGMFSHFITVLDGHMWSDDNEEEAQYWKSKGVFTDLEPFHRLYKP